MALEINIVKLLTNKKCVYNYLPEWKIESHIWPRTLKRNDIVEDNLASSYFSTLIHLSDFTESLGKYHRNTTLLKKYNRTIHSIKCKTMYKGIYHSRFQTHSVKVRTQRERFIAIKFHHVSSITQKLPPSEDSLDYTND